MGCGDCPEEDDQDKEFQDLKGWEAYSLNALYDRLYNQFRNDEVRVYTVASTKFDNGMIRHKGSGPNLEGGLATLCTCKRSMRAACSKEYWAKEKWILGLTSRAKSNGFEGRHHLLYLMKVGYAFDSHFELFHHLDDRNPNALNIKLATSNQLGDVFVPLANSIFEPKNPRMYKSPRKGHSHGYKVGEEWESDIRATPLLLR